MDSSGKYLDTLRMFLGQQASVEGPAGQCSALCEYGVSQDTPGRLACIIIPTGTNDLRAVLLHTAEAVSEDGSEEEYHRNTAVSGEITCGYATLPGVYLAYHLALGP
ncbi:hypothetical protein AAFF_G00188850 [Aldrovandia affinis]|uniref:Uncharacterized protein n=1 Tax=Aldrovandia affinis TaxID=143900 RepID=A0AAD7SYZ4_9TELE|nr:hypothetical protein AAFF_G00188850 [Aldrovandia affinis]